MKPQGKIKPANRKAKKKSSSPLSPAQVVALAEVFNVSPQRIRQITSAPENPLEKPRNLTAVGSWAAETLIKSACYFEGFATSSVDAKTKELWQREADECDEALGIMLRQTSLARFRAERSRSTELLVWAIGDALSAMKRLPTLFKQFERIADPNEFESDEPDTFPCQLVEALVDLVKYFEDQSERHPERFRLLARELPYWPFLVTPHRAGYRKRFDRISGKGFLSLGTECPLDTSSHAMYRLQTPVCGLLWEEIFRDWINVSAGVRAVRRAARECSQPVDAKKEKKEIADAVAHSGGSDAEREIFRAAFALPDLNKSTAPDWASKFVIPYLHFKFADWQKVPALEKFIGKKGGDSQAEKEIRRVVEAMARA